MSFPVNTKSLNEILIKEGKSVSPITISYSGVVSASRTAIGSSTAIGYGQGFFCTSVVISVRSAITVGVQVLIEEANDGDDFQAICQPFRNRLNNETISVPVNTYLKDFPLVTVYSEHGDGTTTADINVVLLGYTITDSQNWDANNNVLWVGDSISAFSGLPQNNYAKKFELHPFMVNNYLISKGKDTRLSIIAKGGTTSTQGESARKRGFFDAVGRAEYYFYHFGMNDASQSVASSVYTENIGSFITWALSKNPNAKIIILGISPAQPTVTNTNAITLRAAASAYVSGLALSNVYYCELGNAFDRTDNNFYSSADTTGQGIHPNIAGMSAIYDTIEAFLIANNIA